MAPPKIWRFVKRFRCEYCRIRGWPLTVDHILPRAAWRGSTSPADPDDLDNLAAACWECNVIGWSRTTCRECRASSTPANISPGVANVDPSDLELLRIEIGTIWKTDRRGRITGPDLVIASAPAGLAAGIGVDVPDGVTREVVDAVARARPATDLHSPPTVLERCRVLLESVLGPIKLAPSSGPSYLIPEQLVYPSDVTLVRSDGNESSTVRTANPGNWTNAEWDQLVEGRLGPWVMAIQRDMVVSICHTPAVSERGAEAGVWTRPEFRGQGYAVAVTAAWATLARPSGRHLFYSTAGANVSSQRVAARLGLRPLGWLWQLTRARTRASHQRT